jgi:Domain of unknown function (DUF4832)
LTTHQHRSRFLLTRQHLGSNSRVKVAGGYAKSSEGDLGLHDPTSFCSRTLLYMNWSRLALLAVLIALPMMACGPSNPCAVPPDTRPLAPLNRTSSNTGNLPLILRDTSSEAVFRRSELSNPMRGAFNWLGRVPPGSSELNDPNLETVFSEDIHSGPVADGGTPDVYHRFPWRWFFKNGSGPDAAQYDFSLLDQYLDRMAPANSGRKLHLGFMPLAGRVGDVDTKPFWRGNAGMPDYIRDHLMQQNPPRGVYFAESNSTNPLSYRRNADASWWRRDVAGHFPDWFFWPDWNDDWYNTQIEAFMKALAEHKTSLGVPLRDDPRLGGLEVRFYGRWGEWHVWGLDYPTLNKALGLTGSNALRAAPDEPQNPSNARRRILEAHAKNFPNTRLALLTGPQNNVKTFRWALEQYPNAGWRRDSFMTDLFEHPFEQFMDVVRANGGFDLNDPVVGNRWMTAPIWAERGSGCGGPQQSPQLAPGQVERFHISLLANQMGDEDRFIWDRLSKKDQQFWFEAVLRSGFRLQLAQVSIPPSVARGGQLEVGLTWENVGVAPVYEAFDVMLELRRNGKPVWSGRSGLDLRKLLPAGSVVPDFHKAQNLIISPHASKDSFSVPSTLERGAYEVWIKAIDPNSNGTELQRRYARLPLRFAHQGRSSDGAYPIGKLEVK